MAPRAAYLVPASTTNLGPGFDCLGIALELYNRFEAELADSWAFTARGLGADEMNAQDHDLVTDAMRQIFSEAGRFDLCARVFSESAVPLANGLGSSSTALVGGMLLARDLLSQLPELAPALIPDNERLLQLLTEAEGHPDNVAPALLGGFTICWTETETGAHCVSIRPAAGLATVVVPSRRELRTSEARRVLPAQVSREDAIYNLSHTALLVASILDAQPAALRAAMSDRLHEPYRATLIEDFEAVRAALLATGADGAFLSGAGPTVAALIIDRDDATAFERARAVAEVFNAGVGATFADRLPARPLALARDGALKVE
ncbi:MAG: homoserine kinase [Actinomycetia bacterium]|nr:homoserine kinase [Actinomycetes bacterium]